MTKKTKATKEAPEAKEDTPIVTPAPRPKQGKRTQISVSIDEETLTKLEQVFFDGRGKYRNRNDVFRTALQYFLEHVDTMSNEPS